MQSARSSSTWERHELVGVPLATRITSARSLALVLDGLTLLGGISSSELSLDPPSIPRSSSSSRHSPKSKLASGVRIPDPPPFLEDDPVVFAR